MKPNAKRTELKKKLGSMRSSYYRELRKVKENARAGKTYVPKLWYYEYFSFLGEKEDSAQKAREVEDFNSEDEDYEVRIPQKGEKEDSAQDIWEIEDVNSQDKDYEVIVPQGEEEDSAQEDREVEDFNRQDKDYAVIVPQGEEEDSVQEDREVEDFNSQDKDYEVRIPQETEREAHSIEQINDVSFNADVSCNKSVSSTSSSETDTSTSTPPKQKKLRFDAVYEKQKQLLDTSTNLLISTQDQCELMGLSFGMQLRELDAEQQAIAQKLMSDVLYYGKMKKLTYFSTVQLSPSSRSPDYYIRRLSPHSYYSRI